MEVGEKIRIARKAQGLSQTELAKKAGVGINTVNRYETGKNFPRLDVLERVFGALEVDISPEEMNQYERECKGINLKTEMESAIIQMIQEIKKGATDCIVLAEGVERLANAYRLMGFANDNDNNSFLS